jgi:hypothetical protein
MRTTGAVVCAVVILGLLGATAVALANVEPSQEPTGATPSASATPSGSASATPVPSASPTSTSGAAPAPDATPSELTSSAAPPPARQDASVIVTYADVVAETGAIEVGAYASVVEDAGTCTLVATRGSTTVQASRAAVADVSTMSCGGLTLPRSQTGSGTWSLTVAYDSATSSGTSAPVEVSVP